MTSTNQNYTARRNVALRHANGHVFDMHGEDENTNNGSKYAGHEIRIENNTVLAGGVYGVVIRGNCFARGSKGSAILQRFHRGNLHSSGNHYGRRDPDCTRRQGWYMWPGGGGDAGRCRGAAAADGRG